MTLPLTRELPVENIGSFSTVEPSLTTNRNPQETVEDRRTNELIERMKDPGHEDKCEAEKGADSNNKRCFRLLLPMSVEHAIMIVCNKAVRLCYRGEANMEIGSDHDDNKDSVTIPRDTEVEVYGAHADALSIASSRRSSISSDSIYKVGTIHFRTQAEDMSNDSIHSTHSLLDHLLTTPWCSLDSTQEDLTIVPSTSPASSTSSALFTLPSTILISDNDADLESNSGTSMSNARQEQRNVREERLKLGPGSPFESLHNGALLMSVSREDALSALEHGAWMSYPKLVKMKKEIQQARTAIAAAEAQLRGLFEDDMNDNDPIDESDMNTLEMSGSGTMSPECSAALVMLMDTNRIYSDAGSAAVCGMSNNENLELYTDEAESSTAQESSLLRFPESRPRKLPQHCEEDLLEQLDMKYYIRQKRIANKRKPRPSRWILPRMSWSSLAQWLLPAPKSRGAIEQPGPAITSHTQTQSSAPSSSSSPSSSQTPSSSSSSFWPWSSQSSPKPTFSESIVPKYPPIGPLPRIQRRLESHLTKQEMLHELNL
ncbi:hypothetical protein BGZ51_007764 [Haplosporangium sp. Z 767]|nr:hypothetical protein BGZ51_007764 [Haplosporangium sp. Z 767]